jgi:hypothetical protein
MQPSDSSPVPRQLRLLDFLSQPEIAHAIMGQTRSPRFRRDPFERDVAFDPGRASAPRVAAPHILPSAVVNASAPAVSVFRGSIPHPTQLLCTLRRGRHLPRRNTRCQADATPYLGRTCTGWIAPASPGAPPPTLCRFRPAHQKSSNSADARSYPQPPDCRWPLSWLERRPILQDLH